MLGRKDLQNLLTALRAAGVKRYRDGDLELELHIDAGARGAAEAHNLGTSGATPEPATEEPTSAEKDEAGLALLLRSSGSGVPARLKERLRKVAT